MASPQDPATNEADYIIVGGGTAGMVVANRLTEDPSVSVLVLEAGQNLATDARVNVPALWMTLLGSEVDWQFKTVPQVSKHKASLPSVGILRPKLTLPTFLDIGSFGR